MILEPARAESADALADIHASSFDFGWTAEDIAALLASPGGFGFVVRQDGQVRAMLVCRVTAGEAEVLTVAVDPHARRQGMAQALLEAGCAAAAAAGAEAMFLEVAADNPAALGLYDGAGFARVGARPGYYRRGNGAVDAVVMRRDLNSRPA
jgi:ribosomal-protein-alanine N-acetyltransferase